MPYATNANVAELGIAKQSGEGSAASNPTYALPVFSGLPNPTQTINEINVTDTSNALPMVWKGEEGFDFNVTIPGFPDSLGTFLKGILPTDTKTGGGDPYTHTFDPTGTNAWFTLFSLRPGALNETFADGVVESVAIEFNRADPLKITVTGKGKTPSVTSAYTAGTTDALGPTTEFFYAASGTFKMTVAGTPATDTVTNVASGTITITRTVTPEPTADSITTVYFNKERLQVSADLDLVFLDYGAYRSTFYGAAAGTAASQTIARSSLDFLFPCYNNANHDLEVKLPSVFLEVDPPQPDPSGAALHVHTVATGIRPASGNIVTVVLRDAISTAF